MIKKPIRLVLLLVCLLLASWPAGAAGAANGLRRPGRQHQVFFANTPNELNVYRVYGAENGKTLMIIGGIQGDEPGGFLSADLYADISLAKGNLIVVPRANYYSIILKHRGPDGDMNRQFGDPVTARRHKQIVAVLKKLMAESDLLLNLHEGSGFFRPKYKNSMENPRRYGQCLIADTNRFVTPDGRVIDLKALAEKVLAKVNPYIKNPKYKLLFNNHRTAAIDSIHKEQRRSATYYALTQCGIPAFGVETSKSLPNVGLKIRHHTLVINSFMEELGITKETPQPHLKKPEFKFLLIQVNNRQPVMVPSQADLLVNKGDQIKILHIEANYERGVSCDILGKGSINDLRQAYTVTRPTNIVVRKDYQKIGKIRVIPGARPEQSGTSAVRSPILYFLVKHGGHTRVIAHGQVLKVARGDRITLIDVLSNLPNQRDMQVNFRGYVPPGQKGSNRAEDRGYEINTGEELLPRFSNCGKDPSGKQCFKVNASISGKNVGEITVEVRPAHLEYLVLRNTEGKKLVYHNGETIKAISEDNFEVVDYKTNLASPGDLKLALQNQAGQLVLPRGKINFSEKAVKEMTAQGPEALRLVVLRSHETIGHLRLQIGE